MESFHPILDNDRHSVELIRQSFEFQVQGFRRYGIVLDELASRSV